MLTSALLALVRPALVLWLGLLQQALASQGLVLCDRGGGVGGQHAWVQTQHISEPALPGRLAGACRVHAQAKGYSNSGFEAGTWFRRTPTEQGAVQQHSRTVVAPGQAPWSQPWPQTKPGLQDKAQQRTRSAPAPRPRPRG